MFLHTFVQKLIHFEPIYFRYQAYGLPKQFIIASILIMVGEIIWLFFEIYINWLLVDRKHCWFMYWCIVAFVAFLCLNKTFFAKVLYDNVISVLVCAFMFVCLWNSFNWKYLKIGSRHSVNALCTANLPYHISLRSILFGKSYGHLKIIKDL